MRPKSPSRRAGRRVRREAGCGLSDAHPDGMIPSRRFEMSTQHVRARTRAWAPAAAAVALFGIATVLAQAPAPTHDSATVRGIDRAGMDTSVPPGDDFFAFANGTWVARTQIPPDRSSWGVFNVLADKSTLRTRDLLEAAAR